MHEGPLLKAAETGDTAAVRALLSEGAEVDERTSHGDTALMRAAASGHVEMVLLLLDAGADVNAMATSGMTALMRASFFGHTGVVRALLDRGADPHLTDRTGMTALDWAGAKGETEAVNILKGIPAPDAQTSAALGEVNGIAASGAHAEPRAEAPGPDADGTDRGAFARPEASRHQPPSPAQDAEGEVTQVAVRARPRTHPGEDLAAEVLPPPTAREREGSPPRGSSDLLRQAGLFVVLTLFFAALSWVILEWTGIFIPREPSPAPSPAEVGATGEAAPASKEAPHREDAPQPARSPSDDEALTAALGDWVAATNAQDIERQMGFYAERLHTYYRRRNVTSGFVRNEKADVFAKARKVEIRAGVPEIEYGGDNLSARMRFRKTYLIDGGPGARRGEVIQELFWRHTKNGWKIVGERDAEVIR